MQTIWLEFKHENGAVAANGSDVTFFIDGRWNQQTTNRKIREQVARLRQTRGSRYTKQLFIGYTIAGSQSGAIRFMEDPEPPEWAGKETVQPKEWRTYV